MSNEKPGTRELFRRISQLSSEAEWTPEENRQALAEAGIDPEALTARVLANLKTHRQQAQASWRDAAHAKRSALLQNFGWGKISQQLAGLNRPQLLGAIKNAIDNLSAATRQEYVVAHRKFEKASDDDLRSMLEELEILREVERSKDGGAI